MSIGRRNLFVLGGALLARPGAGRAQPGAAMPRVGCLTVAPIDSRVVQQLVGAFRDGLREHGYVEGRTIALEYRSADGRLERLPDAMADLLRLKVTLVAAFSNAATHAARHATSVLPIVSFNLGDPVSEGLAASLARPGGNVTGFTIFAPELVPKGLSLLKEAVQKASRIAALWSPGSLTESTAAEMLQRATAAASALGVGLTVARFRAADELDAAFASIAKGGAEALLVLPSPLTNAEGSRIASLAARHRLPAMSWNRYFVEVGGLMAYGSNLADNWRRGAGYVDRILRGAHPGDLPIEQPTRFELVINLQTARRLGLNIAPSLLARADHVIG